MSKTLIHTALLCEAQSLINFFKLEIDTTVKNLPKYSKLYINNEIILIVSGIGKENTIKALTFVFETFKIKKAINLGIAGCGDSSIKIGTLFCTNKLLPNINFAPITTVDKPLECDSELETLLVDMEAKYFIEVSKEYNISNTYIFKVISDYLDLEIPKKAFVLELMQNNFAKWKIYI
jgi:nucleoside phosphorylase